MVLKQHWSPKIQKPIALPVILRTLIPISLLHVSVTVWSTGVKKNKRDQSPVGMKLRQIVMVEFLNVAQHHVMDKQTALVGMNGQ